MFRKKAVLLFSGGLDSTGALYHLLTSTTIELEVHYCIMEYSTKLHEVEKPRADKIVNWCKDNIRDFSYTISKITFPYVEKKRSDYSTLGLLAGIIANYEKPIFIARGVTKSDYDSPSCNGLNYTLAINRFFKVYNKVCTNKTIIYHPVVNFTKKELFHILPKELQKLIWSCRYPSFINNKVYPCNTCPTCLDYKKEGLIHNIHEE